MLANDPDRRTFLRATAVALAGGSFGLLRQWQAAVDRTNAFALADELSALGSATAWINSPALTAASLKGKVVLVQFWTFTCINWLRTLPYTRTWAQSYGNAGLVVIGVHAPEFAFEHDLTNVRRAAADLKVEYPIAVDNDYAIWRGFRNQYWPALYLLDPTGRVRSHQFGEGGYAESERMIRQLLDEAGAQDAAHETVVVGRGIEAAADWDDLRSVENYVGYARTEGFASSGGAGRRRTYTAPRELGLNQWALEGDWTVERDAIVLNQPNGKIAYCFHGRDLHLVMGPPAGARAVRFRVTLDGQPPGAMHGVDADAQGIGVATEQRLHQLIRQSKPIVDRVFRIEYLDSGVEAYSFTFG